MPEELMIRHCSPTLAGLKTGNLFSCAYQNRASLYRAIAAWNRRLSAKGLRILPLQLANGRALIYLYRPECLKRDLTNRRSRHILCRYGYPVDSVEQCLVCLVRRLGSCGEFPHEIGLFLGYPPEDVDGFIEQHAENHKCCGCWKVYGDVEAAQRSFARYEACTRVYCRLWADGYPVEALAVRLGENKDVSESGKERIWEK